MRGKVWKYGDHIDTDVIIPARYLNDPDPAALASHCMVDIDEGFAGGVQAGDIMVGGKHADTTEGTCCESFVPVKGDSYTNTTKHPSATISIDCEAVKCVYNKNYKCVADHVDISGMGAVDSKGTECSTFKEK